MTAFMTKPFNYKTFFSASFYTSQLSVLSQDDMSVRQILHLINLHPLQSITNTELFLEGETMNIILQSGDAELVC